MPRLGAGQLPQLLSDFRDGTSLRRIRNTYRLNDKGLLRHLIHATNQGLLDEAALSRLLLEKSRHGFPRNPERRLETVLSCMNGELKQATLLVVDDEPLTRTGIWKLLGELADTPLPDARTFYDYCTQTLCPAGFLIQEIFGKGLRARCSCFSLSPKGAEYGQPIAAFSLRYAVDHDVSLYELLGPTSSAGDSRAPYNRARIIELLAEGCTQIVELEDRLGLAHTDINYHLTHLQGLGLVEFRSLKPERGPKRYRWVKGKRPEQAKTVSTRRKLTGDVAKWLYRNRIGNPFQIATQLGGVYPQDVSKVLVGLSGQGLAQTEFVSTSRSAVRLRKRSAILLEYVRAVRSALSDNSALKEMEATLREFQQDKRLFAHYVDGGAKLYSAASPMINARKARERELELSEFVQRFQRKHGRGPRPSETMRELGWNHGTLRIYVNSLIRKGRMVKGQDRGSVSYVLKS